MNVPSDPPSSLLTVQSVTPGHVLIWLRKGMNDLLRNPVLSLMHGLLVFVMGWFIVAVAHDRFWLLAGAFSGFLVVAPVLATSLYAMSRAFEKKEPVNIALLIRTWTDWQLQQDRHAYWSMVRFGLLLGLAATGWVLTSSSLITLFSAAPVHTPMDFVHYVVLQKESHLFELWLGLGGLMAAPVFASTVTTIPLLLDRQIRLWPAVLTSWQVVLNNPVSMSCWALCILLLCLLGFFTGLLALIVCIPLLGHASWHAYRDLVSPIKAHNNAARTG